MHFIFRSLAVFLLSCLSVSGAWSQSLGVNNSGAPAHSSSILDVSSTDKGMLIPRMTKSQKNAIASPATGLLVFQTSPDSVGFHYYDGAVWTWLANANKALDSTAWLTTGNTGLNDTSFLGHRDNKPVMFRSNNVVIGRLNSYYSNYGIGRHAGHPTGVGHVAIGDSAGAVTSNNFPGAYLGYLSGRVNTGGNNAFFGAWSGANNISGFLNFFGGTSSGYQNTTGAANTYLGHFAGYDNQTGNYNVAIGYRALKTYTGSNVTAIGFKALDSLTTGTRATAVGYQALMQNTTGDRNTAVGYRSLDSNKTGNNNTGLGYGTLFRNRVSYNTALGDNNSVNTTTGEGNTTVGALSFSANTTGYWNTVMGVNAMLGNTTGHLNTSLGFQSLFNNTTGLANTSTGTFSMFDNRNGSYNVVYGYDALARNDSGSNNVAVGLRSQYAHNRPFSSYNVSIGNYSLENDTTGFYNVALGTSTLRLSRNSVGNTAVGTNALYNHARGDNNTAVGFESMPEDTSGSLNTAIGWRSLRFNRSGSENTALGVGTLEFMDSSARNTAVGRGAMIGVLGSKLTADNVAVGFYAGGISDSARRATMIGRTAGYRNQGDENVFVGYNSGYGAIAPGLTGIENTGLGSQTLVYNTSGRSNTALGMGALYFNQTGSNNTAVGVRAMVNSTTGNRNVVVGDSSMMFSNGNENISIGHKSMQFNNTGNENVAIGKFALQSNNIGSQNAALGTNAGISNTSGSLLTFVGHNSNPSSNNLVNASAFGARSLVSQSNSLVLGSINGLNGATATVNVGIGLTNPSARLHVRRTGTSPIGFYTPNSSMILEENGATIMQLMTPSTNEASILSGSNLTPIRSGIFFTNDSSIILRSGGNVNRLIVENTGNIGIGTMVPLQRLHITGAVNSNANIRVVSNVLYEPGFELIKNTTGGSDWKMRVDGSGLLTFSRATDDFATTPTDYFDMATTQFRPAADGGASLGAPGNRWSTVYAVNGAINTSDAREKENIETLNYGLRELMQLRPVSYTWKKNPEWGKKIGFIAQEVQPILKEVVQKGGLPSKENELDDQGKPVNPDNDRLGIYYSDIIPVTVKAIQEQQQQIDQQNKIIEELRSQNKALQNDLRAIKEKLGIQ